MSDVTADGRPMQAALRLIDAGRPDDAVTELSRLLAQSPTDVAALGLLSLAHLRAHRWVDALAAADTAIGLQPDYVPAWQRRCIALIELDRMAEAESSALHYLRLAPDQWHAHYTLARVLRLVRGRRREALAHAYRAVELAPNDADALNLLGVVYRALEDQVNAERSYRAALAIDPTHALARSNLALLTLGRGGTEEVMAGLRAAAASDPLQETIHRNMALVAVLALLRRGTVLALIQLLVVWLLVVDPSGTPIRLGVFTLAVLAWLGLIGWWLHGLRPYLRSLVPAAAVRIVRASDARWGLFGTSCAVVLGLIALWSSPFLAQELVLIGYGLQIIGSLVSRRLTTRRRRRAASDRA